MEKEHTIENWKPLIIKICRRYTDERPIEDSEMFAECCIKFMRCVELYDATREIKFITYLYAAIEKTCCGLRKKENKRKKIEKTDFYFQDNNLKENLIAYEEDYVDHVDNIYNVAKVLALLDTRTQYIMLERSRGRTLESIGSEMGLSKERIRQLIEIGKKKVLAEMFLE